MWPRAMLWSFSFQFVSRLSRGGVSSMRLNRSPSSIMMTPKWQTNRIPHLNTLSEWSESSAMLRRGVTECCAFAEDSKRRKTELIWRGGFGWGGTNPRRIKKSAFSMSSVTRLLGGRAVFLSLQVSLMFCSCKKPRSPPKRCLMFRMFCKGTDGEVLPLLPFPSRGLDLVVLLCWPGRIWVSVT